MFFFLGLINKVQCEFQILFDPRTWLIKSDNPWNFSLLFSFVSSFLDEWISMFSLTSYRKFFYDLISRQLQNPVYFFLIVELKSKFLKALHIFKIWKTLLIYFSCKLSWIFWSSFYSWSKTNEKLKLLTPFLLYSILIKHFLLD